MSSSGSRGPPVNRYSDRGEYDYNKQRRKNFYASSSRRGGPGSSSLTRSKLPSKSSEVGGLSSESHYSSGGRARYGASSSSNSASRNFGPNVRDNRSSYGSYGPSKGAYSTYNSSYYSGYGGYGNFSNKTGDYQSNNSSNFYSSRGDGWRGERTSSSGDSRLASSKPLSLSASTYNGRQSNGSLINSKPLSSATTGEYRRDKYSTYNQLDANGSKWKGGYNSGKPTLNNRSSYSGSAGSRSYSSKDRLKSSLSGSSALMNTGKRNDTYYPSRTSYSANSSNQVYNKTPVDRYSSKAKPFQPLSDYKNRTLSAEEDEPYNMREETPSDHYSPSPGNDYDQLDDTKGSEDDYEPDISHQNIAKEIHEGMQNEENDREDDNEEDDEDEDEGMEAETTDNLVEHNLKDEINDKHIQNEEHIVKGPEVFDSVVKIDVSNEICYPDGCTFPVNKLETDFRSLQAEFENFTKVEGNYLKYSLANPVEDLHDYPFFKANLKSFAYRRKNLSENLAHENRLIQRKKLSLWKGYSKGLADLELQREKMDQQLKLIHPPDDEMKKELEAIDVRIKQDINIEPVNDKEIPPPPSSNNRRNRSRHGDLVTTEAEFQEILQSLGKEQDEDPIIRAQKVSAPIPDFILDPVERNVVKFMDSNNIVDDKPQWTNRVKTDFQNNFSAEEHSLFCEGFCMFPKRFGAISRHMGGLRTAEDCVLHYYMTKKEVNYKQLILAFKKKASRKSSRRGKTAKSRNVSQNNTPITTPTAEVNGDSAIEYDTPISTENSTEYFGEEVFTDTGRRKRAAAPVFDGVAPDKKKADSLPETKVNDSSIQLPKRKIKKQKKEDGQPTALSEIIEANADVVPITTQTTDTNETELDLKESESENAQLPEQNDTDSKERRKTISSYWSITEANLFPSLLMEHGTKWTTIADKLTTKSATMVRNYFQRNAERHGWNEIAENADQRQQAKFAAVLNTTSDSNTKQEQVGDKYPIYPPPPVINTSTTPTTAHSAYIPIGTFHHMQPGSQNLISASPIPPSTAGASIVSDSSKISVVSNDSKIYDAVHDSGASNAAGLKQEVTGDATSGIPPKVAPKPIVSHSQLPRSSIMSLLNSDSSPVKPEQRTTTDLKSLLNSPSNALPSRNSCNTPPSGNGLDALLSAAASSSNPGEEQDKQKK